MNKTDNTVVRTYVYRLYPNKVQKYLFNQYCDYRRYIWNHAMDYNDYLYRAYRYEKLYYSKLGLEIKANAFCSSYPTFNLLDKKLNANKKSWEYKFPSKIALMAKHDFQNAVNNFINKAMPDWGYPRYKSKKAPRQGFKLPNESIKLNNKTITLAKGRKDKKHTNLALKTRQKFLDYPTGTVSFYTEKNRYYVAVPYYIPKADLKVDTTATGKVGIDLNVKHYDLYDGKHTTINLKLKKLERHYNRVKWYQKLLAKKRKVSKSNVNSHNYFVVKTKLQNEYDKINHLQQDFLQKLTTKLCKSYQTIIIEDLDAKHMKMGIASKGLHRAMFGKFRSILTYKANQYQVNLVVADKFYPSTQICSHCGFCKTGDDKITLFGNKKHHTDHNTYICYNCGYKSNRDQNAAKNLYQYLESNWLKETKVVSN